jgi:hypothetical protein
MSGTAWSIANANDSFKIKYGKLADKVFNAGNPVTMQLQVKKDFVGKSLVEENPLGFSGSVGSRVLPKSNVGNYVNSTLTSKKLYATVIVDRESMKASSTNEGAFFNFMDKPVKDAMDSFDRNRSRMLYGDGSGILALGAAGATAATDVTGAGTSGNPYIVPISVAQWNEANWEEKDYVQMVTGITSTITGAGGTAEGGDAETNLLEVVLVNTTDKKISLVGTSAVLAGYVAAGVAVAGTGEMPANAGICMQRSYQGDFTGLRLISKASEAFDSAGTITSLYGIPTQRRWRMFVKDAAAGALTKPLLNEMAITIEKRCGKTVNIIVPSYKQFQKMLDLSEDQKRYTTVAPSAANFKKAIYGFEAVEYMTTTGPIPVVPDRMVKEDEIFFLNKNYIEYRLRPGGAEWATEDGTTFLRVTNEDQYEARYCCYGELFISPSYQGHLKNLA